MTTVLRMRPRGWRERLAVWVLGDAPACINVVFTSAPALAPLPWHEGENAVLAARCSFDLSTYDAMAKQLEQEAHGDAVTVPAGLFAGLPVGISFIGAAWSEPVLIRLAYAYEQATRLRRPPEYRPTVPLDGE